MKKFEIDEIDKKIIKTIMKDATLSHAVIGHIVNLSASAVNERIRKLKAEGIITFTAAFINAEAIGRGLCAFIYVLIDTPENGILFQKKILPHEEILECHHVTGEYSFLIKIRVSNTKALERFLAQDLKKLTGVIKTFTQIVLSSPKDKSVIVEVANN